MRNPGMIAKRLATKAGAEKWFNAQPRRADNIVPLNVKATANP
jgi:hypothetical protein